MYQDFKDLLSAFHARGVKYLIVGGYAVILHAQPRATKDIDLLIQTDLENAGAIFSALADFGLPLGDIKPGDFAARGNFFRFGHDPQGVDILSEIPGVEFQEAWRNRVESIVDPQTGQSAYFISEDDLLRSKIASGRPQDLADADAIRQAMAVRRKRDRGDNPTGSA